MLQRLRTPDAGPAGGFSSAVAGFSFPAGRLPSGARGWGAKNIAGIMGEPTMGFPLISAFWGPTPEKDEPEA